MFFSTHLDPTTERPAQIYKVGGHLPLDSPSYVVRQADRDLYEGLKARDFCYVLNCRQMGKTSLRVRTMHRLQSEGFACAAIDLTRIGSQDITPDQWYAGIMRRLVTSFRLTDQISLPTWLKERDFLPPIQRLSEFVEQILLESISQPIVIFIDEIDSTLSLSFRPDDFFAFIRSCTEYDRLTFALLGVATPSDLIRDKNHTPFNIGRAIELHGFQPEEAQPLVPGLRDQAVDPQAVLLAILDWTGGQPFLTQKLCQMLASSDEFILQGSEADQVAQFVQSHFIDNWEARDEPPHLKTIRDRLLRSGSNTGAMLKLYGQMLEEEGRGQGAEGRRQEAAENCSSLTSFPSHSLISSSPYTPIPADDSPEQIELRLSGLVVKREGILQIYNRIYATVFDAQWVQKGLASLRPDFLQMVFQQEQRLLAILDTMDRREFEDVLYEILGSVSLQLTELMKADRAMISFVDRETNELWAISARHEATRPTKIHILSNQQSASQITIFKQVIPQPHDFSQQSRRVVEEQAGAGYRTITDLTVPLLDEGGDPIAFVQLINKLRPGVNANMLLAERLAPQGFTESDRQQFAEYTPAIQRLIERCQVCYRLTQRLQASEALTEATRSLSEMDLNSEEVIARVMESAKKLMNADRSTLWLIDRHSQELWTRVRFEDGRVQELRLRVGEGYAGRVAETGEPLNIPFDLYDHPYSETAKRTDQTTGYRTCSLLCMPVYSPDGDLLGVTQLVNKRRQGTFPPYDPNQWPEAPECFRASFDSNSQQYMQIFNGQAGIALSNARQMLIAAPKEIPSPSEAIRHALDLIQGLGQRTELDDRDEQSLRMLWQQVELLLRDTQKQDDDDPTKV
ncbi:MAG: AAA-like domain-containing protein [Leptolyngbyaceae cyanobacterium bins.59]|nr:AAA-like domain-containing protein [Leptolyngbyaceae cyanobacterium bins.59]